MQRLLIDAGHDKDFLHKLFDVHNPLGSLLLHRITINDNDDDDNVKNRLRDCHALKVNCVPFVLVAR